MTFRSVKRGRRGSRPRGVSFRFVPVALIAAVGLTAAAVAQEDEPIPTVPRGTPAVLFPIQAALPTPGGAWPAGLSSEEEVLETLHAEISFAFGEERDAQSWALPEDLVRRLRQNPTLRVNPHRLAYQVLLRKPKKHAQIPEPLHSQMRQVAALFNARLAVLPLRVWYAPEPVDGRERVAEDESAPDGGPSGAGSEARGRLVLLAAVIDTRRSAVLWHGEIEGAVDAPDSSLLLTSLAFRLADHLIP